jgi:hypothetical protein
MTDAEIIQAFISCSGNGGDCFDGFAPQFNVTMPDVGLPEFSVVLPDFSGFTIEGILDAIKMIGLDPCALIGPIAGAAAGMVTQLEGALNDTLQGIADTPQQIANGMNQVAQDNIDAFFAPAAGLLAAMDSPCAGLVGAANEGIAANEAMQGSIDGLQGQINNITAPPTP